MKSVEEILPIELDYKQIDFIVNNFRFYYNNKTNITPGSLVTILNNEIYKQLKYFNDENNSLDNANSDKIKRITDLFYNLVMLNNIDHADYLNFRIRGMEKWINIQSKLGSGAEGNVYKINIKFKDLTSPDLILKKTRESHTSKELLLEFLNYFIVGKLIDFTPNFVSAIGLTVCNSDKIIVDAENNQTLCSCVGKLSCENKNYMIGLPYKGNTFEDILKGTNSNIIIDNFNSINKQIIYSLKIAQEKFQFLHGDLNDRNVSLTIYDTPKTFFYKFNDGSIKKIVSKYKINIFDFGATKFKNLDYLKIVDEKIYEYYNTNFNNQDNKIVNMIKKYRRLQEGEEKNELEVELFNKSKFTEFVSYENAKSWGMINLISDESIKQMFDEDILEKVNSVVSVFDSMVDYKNFIKTLISASMDRAKEFLMKYQDEIKDINNIEDLINKIDPQIENINSILKKTLESVKLQDISRIYIPNDIEENIIDIDGYDADKLYGDEPKFDYMMVASNFDFYNLYGDISNRKCNHSSSVEKKIYWGNPGYSKFFHPNEPINWEDKTLTELPKPIEVGDIYSYTYSFVIDKYNNNISVRYGRITNLTEIGANHVIISHNDKIIVSGELGIKKITDVDYKYYININSSKMMPVNSKINAFNDKNNTQDTNNFYYILMINLALKLFKSISPDLGDSIQIAPGFNIKYGTPYQERRAQGINIVKYYETNECPSDEYIKKYNEFGKDNRIKNACMGFEDGESIENMKKIRIGDKEIIKCEWDDGTLQSNYYSKYLKYKSKYLKLKKLKNNKN